MSDSLVNLNVNPCKMCMPMGAVSALSGIKGCMSILPHLPRLRQHLDNASRSVPPSRARLS